MSRVDLSVKETFDFGQSSTKQITVLLDNQESCVNKKSKQFALERKPNTGKIFHTCIFPRCSRSELFCKKGVLKNFAKFTGKHLCQSLFFDKAAGLRSATLLKKDSGRGVFL